MPRIRKSSRAEADLTEIWLYSFEQWGEQQADRYFDRIEVGIARLADNPALGRPCDAIRAGYRAFQIGRHVVYYRVEHHDVYVARVLHERMAPDERLD